MRKNEFVAENYNGVKVNDPKMSKSFLIGLVLFIASAIIFGVPFFLVNTDIAQAFSYDFMDALAQYYNMPLHFGILMLVVLLVVHELIHAFFYGIYAKNGFKSIKFGADLKHFAVYVANLDVMRTDKFIIGLIMPMIIVRVIPSIIAIFIGNMNVLLFGITFVSAAGGDLYYFSKVRKNSKNTWIHNSVEMDMQLVLYEPK